MTLGFVLDGWEGKSEETGGGAVIVDKEGGGLLLDVVRDAKFWIGEEVGVKTIRLLLHFPLRSRKRRGWDWC